MYYIEYHELLKKYKAAETEYYDTLDKMSKLRYTVEPHAIVLTEEVQHSNKTSYDDNLIEYTDKVDLIDETINKKRNVKDMLQYELKKKEQQLKNSDDIYDKIYVYRWIEHKKIKDFYRLLSYSKRQVYNYINIIKEKIYKND